MLAIDNRPRAPTFLQEIEAEIPGAVSRLELCLQCGTCGGSCPSSPDMDHTPRQLFAMIDVGLKDEVLSSNTPWYCVSCYHCYVRCPQEIPITDIMYSLKRLAIREGQYRHSSAADAPDFSETFVDFVENYGRSFEFGTVSLFHIRHHPIGAVKMARGIGLDMLRKGRLNLTPVRIKNIDQLQAILTKAKELGGDGV